MQPNDPAGDITATIKPSKKSRVSATLEFNGKRWTTNDPVFGKGDDGHCESGWKFLYVTKDDDDAPITVTIKKDDGQDTPAILSFGDFLAMQNEGMSNKPMALEKITQKDSLALTQQPEHSAVSDPSHHDDAIAKINSLTSLAERVNALPGLDPEGVKTKASKLKELREENAGLRTKIKDLEKADQEKDSTIEALKLEVAKAMAATQTVYDHAEKVMNQSYETIKGLVARIKEHEELE